jgi:hypothetical protein
LCGIIVFFLNNEGFEEFQYNFCRGRKLGEHFILSTLGEQNKRLGVSAYNINYGVFVFVTSTTKIYTLIITIPAILQEREDPA